MACVAWHALYLLWLEDQALLKKELAELKEGGTFVHKPIFFASSPLTAERYAKLEAIATAQLEAIESAKREAAAVEKLRRETVFASGPHEPFDFPYHLFEISWEAKRLLKETKEREAKLAAAATAKREAAAAEELRIKTAPANRKERRCGLKKDS